MDQPDRPCDNCGRPTDDGASVHRLYLVPDTVRVAEVEWWCWSCRSQYPHEEAPTPPG